MTDIRKISLVKAIQLIALLFVITIPIVWISLPFTNFTGDLTRIGKLAERDFAWTKEQASIPANLMKSSSISEADVLVVGDSFSESLVWQSELVKNNLKVATVLWPQVGYICKDFVSRIRDLGFKGKYLIIESVERGAQERLAKSADCIESKLNIQNSSYQSNGISGKPQLSDRLNLDGKFGVGFFALINSSFLRFNLNYLNLYSKFERSVRLVKIKDGCRYFSNYLCQLGLFYNEDFTRDFRGDQSIKDVEKVNSNLISSDKSLKVIWVVVPNKSTIYFRDVPSDFWVELSQKELGPNLLNLMSSAKESVIDLYDPNGSHFSTNGYQVLGNSISALIKSTR